MTKSVGKPEEEETAVKVAVPGSKPTQGSSATSQTPESPWKEMEDTAARVLERHLKKLVESNTDECLGTYKEMVIEFQKMVTGHPQQLYNVTESEELHDLPSKGEYAKIGVISQGQIAGNQRASTAASDSLIGSSESNNTEKNISPNVAGRR